MYKMNSITGRIWTTYPDLHPQCHRYSDLVFRRRNFEGIPHHKSRTKSVSLLALLFLNRYLYLCPTVQRVKEDVDLCDFYDRCYGFTCVFVVKRLSKMSLHLNHRGTLYIAIEKREEREFFFFEIIRNQIFCRNNCVITWRMCRILSNMRWDLVNDECVLLFWVI